MIDRVSVLSRRNGAHFLTYIMGEAPEALERAVAEIEALQAIYDTDFVVHSTSELSAANEAIEKGESVEVLLEVSLQLEAVKLRCSFPPGYPVTEAARVSIEGITRKEQDELTRIIQVKANALVGQEALLELVHEVQELAEAMLTEADTAGNETQETDTPETTNKNLRRRWI